MYHWTSSAMRDGIMENIKRCLNQLWLKCWNINPHSDPISLHKQMQIRWYVHWCLHVCNSKSFETQSHFQIICALIMCLNHKIEAYNSFIHFWWVTLNYQSMICNAAQGITECSSHIDRTICSPLPTAAPSNNLIYFRKHNSVWFHGFDASAARYRCIHSHHF